MNNQVNNMVAPHIDTPYKVIECETETANGTIKFFTLFLFQEESFVYILDGKTGKMQFGSFDNMRAVIKNKRDLECIGIGKRKIDEYQTDKRIYVSIFQI